MSKPWLARLCWERAPPARDGAEPAGIALQPPQLTLQVRCWLLAFGVTYPTAAGGQLHSDFGFLTNVRNDVSLCLVVKHLCHKGKVNRTVGASEVSAVWPVCPRSWRHSRVLGKSPSHTPGRINLHQLVSKGLCLQGAQWLHHCSPSLSLPNLTVQRTVSWTGSDGLDGRW